LEFVERRNEFDTDGIDEEASFGAKHGRRRKECGDMGEQIGDDLEEDEGLGDFSGRKGGLVGGDGRAAIGYSRDLHTNGMQGRLVSAGSSGLGRKAWNARSRVATAKRKKFKTHVPWKRD